MNDIVLDALKCLQKGSGPGLANLPWTKVSIRIEQDRITSLPERPKPVVRLLVTRKKPDDEETLNAFCSRLHNGRRVFDATPCLILAKFIRGHVARVCSASLAGHFNVYVHFEDFPERRFMDLWDETVLAVVKAGETNVRQSVDVVAPSEREFVRRFLLHLLHSTGSSKDPTFMFDPGPKAPPKFPLSIRITPLRHYSVPDGLTCPYRFARDETITKVDTGEAHLQRAPGTHKPLTLSPSLHKHFRRCGGGALTHIRQFADFAFSFGISVGASSADLSSSISHRIAAELDTLMEAGDHKLPPEVNARITQTFSELQGLLRQVKQRWKEGDFSMDPQTFIALVENR